MANVDGVEDVDYESDPEEAKMSLTTRRREASDDEEESERRDKSKSPRRIDSEGELDDQGAAAEYDDEDEKLEVDEEVAEEYEELEYEEVEEEYYEEMGDGEVEAVAVADVEREAGKEGDVDVDVDVDGGRSVGESLEVHEVMDNEQVVVEEEGEKKENEPFAVPTAGAFYMHDDRFRDNAGGRNRRTLGGRKLWESKNVSKWGHDKFEEMTMQERHYEEGRRTSRGRYRGRGKSRGADHGYPRGNRPKAYDNDSQNNAPKSVRGRGPRRYQPSTMNDNEAPPTRNREYGKSVEKTSRASSGRATALTSNIESDPAPSRKHVFASSLNSASPPFYPSGSSNKEIALTQKRELQGGKNDWNLRPSGMDESFSMSQSSAVLRGKNVVDSIGMNKLYIDDSIPTVAGKPSTNLQVPLTGSSSNHSTRSPQYKAQGRGPTSIGQITYQPTAPHNQVNSASPSSQLNTIQRSPVQSRVRPSLQASGHQFTQRPGSRSQASSPPKATPPVNSFEYGELESLQESNKSKNALVGKGKGALQGSGRGSFLYGGAQVMGGSGNMGGGRGDQNFPAFLPVMQFGNQHPGGLGVPAVGMAFPGYVQSQLGLGSSEMTWLPVLAGAAGSLGASYCSPYISVDGAYPARPSGQTSSLAAAAASSKENNTNKVGGESKPSQRPELASEEFEQQQNNRRRYTEMKFDQMK